MKKIVLAIAMIAASSTAFAGGNIAAGKEAAAKFNCASCHGDKFTNPIDPSYPKLAGQHKDYLVQALKAYQRGANGLAGRSNAIMEGQAKALSNADIENIAAYLNSLPTELVLKK
ncbi:cytochrome c [Undibacterium cyanobacteriorum]|uniref:Cytochrome c n=1 Tax=Undibacterium cyanobacteriorum TaxID=3073561 RepID=A0ABY9RD09_9BURK|nr:cytochrome c [Undibacterium sp. 20NA77.5]WMW79049.1 cytochrome c [Undibacterium sp. 20NA77.5]